MALSAITIAAEAVGDNGLGIHISKAARRDTSIVVQWDTDYPPPYVLSLFVPHIASFGEKRSQYDYALKYKIVNTKYGCFIGDFASFKGDLTVQVATTAITNSPYWREMSRGEAEEYQGSLKDILDFTKPLTYEVDEPNEIKLHVVGEHLWGGFWVSDTPYVTVNGKCRGFQNMTTNKVQYSFVQEHSYYSNTLTGATSSHKYSAYTNDVESIEYTTFTNVVKILNASNDGTLIKVFEQAIQPLGNIRHDRRCITKSYDPKIGVTNFVAQMRYYETGQRQYGPYDTSIGCGYRIFYNDKDDDFFISRAYSLWPEYSQMVKLRRDVKSLSKHKGMKIGLDWMGQLRFVTTTNGVNDLIYWQGL